MLSHCVIKWWEFRDSLADYSQRWRGIRRGIKTRALLWTFMLWVNGKGAFFRVENFFNLALWMNNISRLVRVVRVKLFRLFCGEKLCKKAFFSGIELICEFPRQFFNHNQNLFSFLLFVLAWRVYKSFWKASVTRTHLHSAARALSSPMQCKDLFHCLLWWDATAIFTNAKRLLTSCVFFSHSETLNFENKIHKQGALRHRNFADFFCCIHLFSVKL